MTGTGGDEFIKISHYATEFEAHAKAAVLDDAGIRARVVADGPSWAGMMRLSRTEFGAGLWVHRDDEAAARDALAQNVADSVDLDWDEVDVGEIEDDAAAHPHTPGRMPLPARIAWVIAMIALIMGLAVGLMMLLG